MRDRVVAVLSTLGLGVLLAFGVGKQIAAGQHGAALTGLVLGIPLLWLWHHVMSHEDLP